MKVEEIVALIKKEQPAVLGKTPDKRAARIIRAAFRQVNAEVGAAKEGVVSMPGLGRFRIRQVERVKEGKKSDARHVVFRAAVAKARAKAKAKPR